MSLYVGINSRARKVNKVYSGVGSYARKVKRVYTGIGSNAILSFQSIISSGKYNYISLTDNINFGTSSTTKSRCVGTYNSAYFILGVEKSYTAYNSYLVSNTFSTTLNHSYPGVEGASTLSHAIIHGGPYNGYLDTASAINRSLTETQIVLGTGHTFSVGGHFSGYGFMCEGYYSGNLLGSKQKDVKVCNSSLSKVDVMDLIVTGDGTWALASPSILLITAGYNYGQSDTYENTDKITKYNSSWVRDNTLYYLPAKEQSYSGCSTLKHAIFTKNSIAGIAFNSSMVSTTITPTFGGVGCRNGSIAIQFSRTYAEKWNDNLVSTIMSGTSEDITGSNISNVCQVVNNKLFLHYRYKFNSSKTASMLTQFTLS